MRPAAGVQRRAIETGDPVKQGRHPGWGRHGLCGGPEEDGRLDRAGGAGLELCSGSLDIQTDLTITFNGGEHLFGADRRLAVGSVLHMYLPIRLTHTLSGVTVTVPV